jgi:hypothetical protein
MELLEIEKNKLSEFIGMEYINKTFKHNNVYKIVDFRLLINSKFEIVGRYFVGVNCLGVYDFEIPISLVMRQKK